MDQSQKVFEAVERVLVVLVARQVFTKYAAQFVKKMVTRRCSATFHARQQLANALLHYGDGIDLSA